MQYLSFFCIFPHQSNRTMSGYKSDVVTRFSLWASAIWLLTRFYEIQPRSTLLLSGEIVSSWVVVNVLLICYGTLYKRHYSPFKGIPGPKVCFLVFLGENANKYSLSTGYMIIFSIFSMSPWLSMSRTGSTKGPILQAFCISSAYSVRLISFQPVQRH